MPTPTLDPRELYRTMATIRRFDARVLRGLGSGEFAFNYWPVEGQEAIAPAVCASLSPSDEMVTTYRCAADAIAKGAPLRELMAELLGKATGTSKGKGGAMGINWPATGLAATTGIVGAGAPIATGLALAHQLRGDDGVVVVSFGDGATSIGAVHEAMNLAGVWKLPVIFLCQNNLYGEGTVIELYTATENFSDRAAGYGFPGAKVDGTDPLAVHAAGRDAIERARRGEGPSFIEAVAQRTQGHYFGDGMSYMDKEQLRSARSDEPTGRFRARLAAEGIASQEELDRIDAECASAVEDAIEFAKGSEGPDVSELYIDVYSGARTDASLADSRAESGPRDARPRSGQTGPGKELTLAAAIGQGLDQLLARDDRVVLLGEDIHDPMGGVFTVTNGLSTKYGLERVRPTPIAETAIVGAAIGAAMAGLRPIAEVMFLDFLGVCLDQLANHAAKLRYMTGGRASVPLVLRIVEGAQGGPQHSQSLEAWLMHTPGLQVVWPGTPFDAKGLLLSAADTDDPVVFIESMAMFFNPQIKGEVPEAEYRLPIGVADVKRPGSDVTLVTYGSTLPHALGAVEALAADGIDVELLDLRTLVPLDLEAVLTSAARTRRLVIAHSATRFCGPGAEIAAAVSAELHGQLAAPVQRVGGSFTPVPRAPELEALHSVSADSIAAGVRRTLS